MYVYARVCRYVCVCICVYVRTIMLLRPLMDEVATDMMTD